MSRYHYCTLFSRECRSEDVFVAFLYKRFQCGYSASSVSYKGHTGGVNAVSCSPVTTSNGKLQFASGGFDKTVQIWQFTP
ncbi:MAG: hypothetical protein ACJ8BW_39755 [Ktedonobacteraceae bacterium]